jgi:hypothetical protein
MLTGIYNDEVCRWDDDITIVLKEMRRKGVRCVHLDMGNVKWWDLLTMVTNFRIPPLPPKNWVELIDYISASQECVPY